MQYNKEKFKYYYDNYKDITSRIKETKTIINELLEVDKLTKTVNFYNSLSDNEKDIFDDINCNINFVRYKINHKMIEELEKGLDELYEDFIDSEAFPFAKNQFHFYVKKDNYLIDAITDVDSSELSKEENIFLNDSISGVNNCLDYNPSDYSEDDIPLIKVLYLKEKYKYERKELFEGIYYYLLMDSMFDDIDLAKRIDSGKYTDDEKMCSCLPEWKRDHLKTKLLTQQQRIIESDSRNKELLLFSIDAAFYEIELQSGVRVNEIYDRLNNMEVKNEHQRRKVEREKDALITAYYNLIDQNFRKNSGYYRDNHYMFARYETANPEINKRMLKMMKR